MKLFFWMMKTMVSLDFREELEQIKYWVLGGWLQFPILTAGPNFHRVGRGGGEGGVGWWGYSIFFCIYLIIVPCPNIALKIALLERYKSLLYL